MSIFELEEKYQDFLTKAVEYNDEINDYISLLEDKDEIILSLSKKIDVLYKIIEMQNKLYDLHLNQLINISERMNNANNKF